MHELKIFLENKFRKPLNEISKTEFGNKLIDKNLKMISWDDVATYFNKTDNEFKDEFSTADGLVVLKKKIKHNFSFLNLKTLIILMNQIGK